MNIYDYFKLALGYNATDTSLEELPVESNCGRDCAEAIDAARAFIAVACRADPKLESDILADCDRVVTIFWRG